VKRKFWKRIFLGFAAFLILLLVLAAHPIFHLARAYWNDRNEILPIPNGMANDASRLDETNIAKIWEIPDDETAAEKQLADLLEYARTNHLKISIAGARHSMGGHTIYPGGIVIDMLPFSRMELDATNLILHVQAGARWSDVLEFLNKRGLSVEVMQSNDDFSVGGSISVNCHGWQFNRAPIACTVQSFRLMLADGKIVKCSRVENSELFSLALGGYGLFGIILDVDLRVVPNEKYKIERLIIPTSDYAKVFTKKTADTNNVAMIYGRLNITPNNFLKDGTLNIFHRTIATNFLVSSLGETKYFELKRIIFRGSANSDYGKNLRWQAETMFDSYLSGNFFERNEILFDPATMFQDHSQKTTDILVEYFVPPKEFEPFLQELRKIVPANHGDLLNITVRDVNKDTDTFLRYADKNMLSLVMLFSQTRDAAGETQMSKMTQEMVAAVLRHDGKYYLPYRLHATQEQFFEAYPQAKKFFELKRKYDPDELFQNEFYLKYGK
jgi:FAD/FMN-containing dehydrogenase